MELVFVNGSEVQQAACRTVAHNLLNLPFDSINLKHTIEFTPDPLPSSHNEFAITAWTYDSNEPFTKIASVAPAWPEPWSGMRFLQETYAHELGHGFFAALPEAARLAILELFGFDTDDVDAIFPKGAAWEDKPGEGVAETFKDAFLPRRFRRYSNRTNHTIPIHRYPTFRSLWRQAAPEVLAGGAPLEPGEVEVPGYHLDAFEEGEPLLNPPPFPNVVGGKGGKKGLWMSNLSNNESGPELHNGQMIHESEWEGWVLDGAVLSYSFTLPVEVFDPSVIGSPYFAPSAPLSQYNDCGIQWQVFTRKKIGVFEEYYHHAVWSKTVMPQKVFEEGFSGNPEVEKVGEWILYYEAVGGGIPPVFFSRSIKVDSSHFTETRKCHGKTYRRVWILAQIVANLTEQWPETTAENERVREGIAYKFIPSLEVIQSPCSASGEPGTPIILPSGSMETGGRSSGRRLKRPTIVGRRR